ncbi:MAG: T9SS type A sorting domain-containing protein [Candidatus Marinimicrobia bacterium]|nr:T9SS type A sorting domain-containing protein [Candidatus Neomarinimicrobiota bacterium]
MRNKKITISVILFMTIVSAQMEPATYLGQLSFDYIGTINGNFIGATYAPPDTLTIPTSFAGSILMSNNDTTHILIPAFQQVTDSTYDVFLIYLRDDSGGVEPQTWTLTIPGEIADLQALAAFMPGIDSAFVTGLLDVVADTTGGISTLDSLLGQLINEIAIYSYFGVSGSITLGTISPDTLGGAFNGTFMQAGFPPPTINITNGVLGFSGIDLPTVAITPERLIPISINLLPAYPNPFNATVRLGYTMDQPGHVQLAVMDLRGRHVTTLVNDYRQAGEHALTWTANHQATGIYLICLETNGVMLHRKIVLLK